jgi:hypothetical protein
MAIPGWAPIRQFREELVVGHWIPSDRENILECAKVYHIFMDEREKNTKIPPLPTVASIVKTPHQS